MLVFAATALQRFLHAAFTALIFSYTDKACAHEFAHAVVYMHRCTRSACYV
jgi:hypothetical protein